MNRKGFTLMELLAVIVIIAIIMALVFPAASRLRRNNENKICVDYHNMMIEYAKSSIKDDEELMKIMKIWKVERKE